jgi:hypothetical protein
MDFKYHREERLNEPMPHATTDTLETWTINLYNRTVNGFFL